MILKKALYGHPDSGTFWERHCDAALRAGGFTPIESWQSCYWHDDLKLVLVVYVDDFKLAVPETNLARGWKLTRERLSLEEPTEANLYLGCFHETRKAALGDGKTARAAIYNMEDYFHSVADKYCELAKDILGEPVKLKHAATPFLTEEKKTSPQQKPCDNCPAVTCPWCDHVFPASGDSPWALKPMFEPNCTVYIATSASLGSTARDSASLGAPSGDRTVFGGGSSVCVGAIVRESASVGAPTENGSQFGSSTQKGKKRKLI